MVSLKLGISVELLCFVKRNKCVSLKSKNQLKSSNMRFAAEQTSSRSAIKAELILTRFLDLRDVIFQLKITEMQRPSKIKPSQYI